MSEEYLNAHDVGIRLRVTKGTVLAWWRAGRIPGRRLAGQIRPVRFLWSEVEAALVREPKDAA